MSSTWDAHENCRQCANQNNQATTCSGCQRSFCSAHAHEHKDELLKQLDKLGQDCTRVQEDLAQTSMIDKLSTIINEWEKDSMKKINTAAEKARKDVKQRVETKTKESNRVIKQLLDDFNTSHSNRRFTETEITKWTEQIKILKEDLQTSFGIGLRQNYELPKIDVVSIKSDKNADDTTVQTSSRSSGKTNDTIAKNSMASPVETSVSLSPQSSLYSAYIFGTFSTVDKKVEKLFNFLMRLPPMDKNGPMSGRCKRETFQMEEFLTINFGFRNLPGKHIVQGVKAFEIKTPVDSKDPESVIHFPNKSADTSFAMKVKEIIQWQRSYKVYAAKGIRKLGENFLKNVLQGQSKDGDEAFYMKFVVRISICPILMEFDGKVIPRQLEDDWPHRIKLVSVTGIDFAGRKHDVGDILHYVSNWKELYEVDASGERPALANDRDFQRKRGRPRGRLEEDRLLKDLKYMAKLRLNACDQEGVQIVVETGIGLGVFAGEQIGIDSIVRSASSVAIRAILEEDGSNYKNIQAVIFALPYVGTREDDKRNNAFTQFTHEFEQPLYKGCIPVLLADQDMHRLTVAIAKAGWVVSQLNPADSHGVFGEYWQNLGPAVEEKLALTTLGLLVQHHIINKHVLDSNNYKFIV